MTSKKKSRNGTKTNLQGRETKRNETKWKKNVSQTHFERFLKNLENQHNRFVNFNAQ
jgi:hypothetical protein